MTKLSANIQKLVVIAMMLALDVALSNITALRLPLLHVGFGFLPLAVVAMLYGPWYAGVVGALADVLGWWIFSSSYPYFFGFTITGLLTGILLGLFLYQNHSLVRIVLVCLIIGVVFSLCLDSFWLMMMYSKLSLLNNLPAIMSDKWFAPFIAQRALKLIMIPIMIVLIVAVQKLLEKMGRLHRETPHSEPARR